MITFDRTDEVNIDIFRKFEDFNEYNNYTKKSIKIIENLLKKEYFEVPFYKRQLCWGEEIVFFPFTDILFKIVCTSHNDTSIQLHPRKNETWYPLKTTTIFNGKKWISVPENKKIVIPKCSVHCMKVNGMVFEVQDNSLFDNEETLRIFDVNGRKIDNYLNYVLPHNLNELRIEDYNKNIISDKDILLFLISGDNYYGENKLESNKLYFVKKENRKNLKLKGRYIITPANYIRINEVKEYN